MSQVCCAIAWFVNKVSITKWVAKWVPLHKGPDKLDTGPVVGMLPCCPSPSHSPGVLLCILVSRLPTLDMVLGAFANHPVTSVGGRYNITLPLVAMAPIKCGYHLQKLLLNIGCLVDCT